MSQIDPPIITSEVKQISAGSDTIHTPEVMPLNATLFGALQGIVSENPRGLANDTTVKLLMFNVDKLEREKKIQDEKIKGIEGALNGERQELSNLKIKYERIKVLYNQQEKTSNGRAVLIFIGTALAGLSLDQFKASSFGYASALLAGALFCIGYGFFSMKGESNDNLT